MWGSIKMMYYTFYYTYCAGTYAVPIIKTVYETGKFTVTVGKFIYRFLTSNTFGQKRIIHEEDDYVKI